MHAVRNLVPLHPPTPRPPPPPPRPPQAIEKKQQEKKKEKALTIEENYDNEVLHYESGPHGGEVAANVLMTWTIVWLPLTVQSLFRAAFLRYRFTDRRVSVISAAPWDKERIDVSYRQVKDVVTIGRGVGLWGDMLIVLQNGDKVTIKSIPQFQELKDYVLQRRDALLA